MANYFEAPQPVDSKKEHTTPQDGMIRMFGQVFHPCVATVYFGIGGMFGSSKFFGFVDDSNRWIVQAAMQVMMFSGWAYWLYFWFKRKKRQNKSSSAS